MVSGLLFSDITDHLPIFSIWFEDDSNVMRNDQVYTFRDKSETNRNKFNNMVSDFDWLGSVCSSTDPNEAYSIFNKHFIP